MRLELNAREEPAFRYNQQIPFLLGTMPTWQLDVSPAGNVGLGQAGLAQQLAHGLNKPVHLRAAGDSVQLFQELVVLLDMAHLAIRVSVLLQDPLGWRRDDQVDVAFRQSAHVNTSIPQVEPVRGRDALCGFADQLDEMLVLGNARDVGLRVFERENSVGHKLP